MWPIRALREPKTTGALARRLRGGGHPSSQTQLPQTLLQAAQEVDSRDPRQIVETVYDKLFDIFGLWRERSHDLQVQGLRARLASRVALCTTSVSGSTTNSVALV
jgi:hypothetical protein